MAKDFLPGQVVCDRHDNEVNNCYLYFTVLKRTVRPPGFTMILPACYIAGLLGGPLG